LLPNLQHAFGYFTDDIWVGRASALGGDKI
jgi:hypothetical protein